MSLRYLFSVLIVALAVSPASAAPTAAQQAAPRPAAPAPAPQSRPAAPAAAQQAGPSALGFWQQVDDEGRIGAWFFVTERNGFYEGRLVKMFQKPGEPLIKVCTKCTGDQKNAGTLGLTIIKGMKRHGREYEDGTILDPRDGNVYHAQMEVSADGQKLSVRGYLGIPLLGKTQVWNRLPDNVIAPAEIPPESLGPTAKGKAVKSGG
jgi:uncharacterized protein (DUF2147 family)